MCSDGFWKQVKKAWMGSAFGENMNFKFKKNYCTITAFFKSLTKVYQTIDQISRNFIFASQQIDPYYKLH